MLKACVYLLVAASAYGHVLPKSERILNGSTAAVGQFPYQVSLRDKPNRHFCGGSIISARAVLTAAHCTSLREAKNVIAVVGVTQITELTFVHEIDVIINHHAWDPQNIANDIAIVKLKEKIVLGGNVQLIALETNEISDGLSGVVSGWGLTSINGNHATNLQFLHSNVINYEECKKLQTSETSGFVKQFNICGLNEYGYGFCNEDSGGPFVVEDKQVGVVSWSDHCGGGRGDVYTKVSYYVDWINANI